MKHLLLLVSVCLVAVPVAVFATTWNVPGDAVTIQAGIDLASAGDTVLVGPDTYAECIVMESGVVLMSSAGPAVTTVVPAFFDATIRCVGLGAGTEIKGFTFTNGYYTTGAAIYCSGSAVTIMDNVFTYNWAVAGDGGGIAYIVGTGGSIENNTFESNWADSWGGAIYLESTSLKITGNQFTNNIAYFGGAIVCKFSSSPEIGDNEFFENRAAKQGGAIHCRYNGAPIIHQNLFRSNVADGSGGAIAFHEDAMPAVRHNVFWDNSGGNASAVGVSFGTNALLENNTFYANTSDADSLPGAIGVYSASYLTMYRCILSNSTGGPAIACYEGSVADLDCNDMWFNDSDYYGCSGGPNDFYLDPWLCDPDHGNFMLDCQSPCADHPVCGLVGTLDVGCGSTRVQSTTWSGIKAIYR
jgi:predicted outer membrane repeat protein